MLSERLKELESEGLTVRLVIPETPVRIEYHLTEKGRALWSVIEAVSGWAEEWLAGVPAPEVEAQAPPPLKASR
jgi:DNA-binding HxlR family transcriptional regulator